MNTNHIRQSIIILLFTLFSCNNETNSKEVKDNEKIIIVGDFYNVTSIDSIPKISLYARDYITKELITPEIKVDSTKTFRFELKLSKQQDIMVLQNTIVRVMVSPGDSIYLSFDAQAKTRKDVLNNLRISGDNSIDNNHINNYFKSSPLDYNLHRQKRTELSKLDYKNFKDSIYSKHENYIDNLIAENNFSDPLKNWFKAEKLFELPASYSFFDLYKSNKTLSNPEHSNQSISIANGKYDIDDLPEMKSELLINLYASNTMSKQILDYYIINSQDEMRINDSIFDYSVLFKKVLNENYNRPDIVQSVYNELTQSFFNQYELSIYEKSKVLIDSVLEGSIYKSNIIDRYTKLKNQINSINIPENSKLLEFENDEVPEALNKILASANSKPIYIDHWGTWCEPCITEFKETPKLKALFQNTVEFVYLCYQCNKKQWEVMISEYNLEGIHYFIKDDQREELNKIFPINEYPSYTLINKKGQIVDIHSEFRPSNPETIDQLNKLKNE